MPLPMKRYLITLDPGQKQDPAAIQVYKAVPELVHPDPLIAEEGKIIYRDDLVMQYKLSDKRYTALADFVVGLMSRKSLSSESVLVFDATGVGAAVKDLFHAQGVKDMKRMLEWNGYPGPYGEDLDNILLFFMCGISRMAERHFENSRDTPITWLSDYGAKCLPSEIAEYLLRDPDEGKS